MIPLFDSKGNLPAGIYLCTFAEVKKQFAYNQVRKRLFLQLLGAIDILRQARCSEIYLDGSFITIEQFPNDYDLCWEPIGIKPTIELKKLLSLDIDPRREKFGGDIFVRMPEPPYTVDPVQIWQFDKDGEAKGILRILLEN